MVKDKKCCVDTCADPYNKVNYYCDDCDSLYCKFHAEALDFKCDCVIRENIIKMRDTDCD